MWVFGYGSLVWKVDFPYEKRVPGYVKGFVRRFWQGSIDHRGTPDSPGRVVTLVPYETWRDKFRDSDPHDHSPVDTCWGVAYKIPASEAERVKAHLDHREKNGYQTFEADVYHPQTGDDVPLVKGALVYVATTDNESFLGPVDLMEMAAQIANTRGPSGWNAHCGLRIRLREDLSDVNNALLR
ncbi:ChaC-like protein [Gaertneriomyces semiglobifer]|nr:ChaC-like protein [Gaertneriomyces semiglobifer]